MMDVAMAPQRATVLEFPVRADAAPRRLRRALSGLDSALAEQSLAVADWRASLDGLAETARGIHAALLRHGDALGDAASQVARLREQSLALAAWAGRHETPAG